MAFVPRKVQQLSQEKQVLPRFQIVGRFGKSRYIAFAMHLDKHYVQIHSKNNVSRFVKTTYNQERREQLAILTFIFVGKLACIFCLPLHKQGCIICRHLTQFTKKGSDPLSFKFVEHHKVDALFLPFNPLWLVELNRAFHHLQTPAFTFISSHDESVWNLDGEIFQACEVSVQACRGLVNLFASGPEVQCQ